MSARKLLTLADMAVDCSNQPNDGTATVISIAAIANVAVNSIKVNPPRQR